MPLPNIFEEEVRMGLHDRIDRLNDESAPLWGKMEVAQMLAHLNVMFESGLENKHPRPNPVVRFILKTFVKKQIVNKTPYKKNSDTAPEMLIDYHPNFEEEKKRVQDYLVLTGVKGPYFFKDRKHPAFSTLSTTEWSNLFYKHIDHHLQQFGV